MSRRRHLVDLQVVAGAGVLDDPHRRAANESLFAIFEPLRLALRDRHLDAPFAKLVISLVDERTMGRHDGHVSVTGGVCEVLRATRVEHLAAHARDQQWVLDIISTSLPMVERRVEWRSSELATEIARLRAESPPWRYFFENLALTDTRTGTAFVPWLATGPGRTEVGVRISGRVSQDIVLRSHDGPLYLEDDFPIVRSALKRGRFVLLGPRGVELASVAGTDQEPT